MPRLLQRAVCGAGLLSPVIVLTAFGWPAADVAQQGQVAEPVRIHPQQDVWVDHAKKRVILEGTVCVPEGGSIEVLACPRETKEYESLLSVRATPQVVEAAILLATPANAGDGTGVEFDVHLSWEDGKVTRRVRAQEWVLDPGTGKPVEGAWRYVRGGRRSEGELLTTSNLGGVLNMTPQPKGNTLPPAQLPHGAKVRIEITPRG